MPAQNLPVSPLPAVNQELVAVCQVCQGQAVVELDSFGHRRTFPCRACGGKGSGQRVGHDKLCAFCLGVGKNAHARTCRRCGGSGIAIGRPGVDWGSLGVLMVAGGITTVGLVGTTNFWLLAGIIPTLLVFSALARRSKAKALEERRRLLQLLESPDAPEDVGRPAEPSL